MNSQTFFDLYKNLNFEQKEAVDTIEGPVMVVAGPGTGKTQILTLRIANILRLTDTSPDSILALTFTESGAYFMRKKLVEIIGSVAYKVHISTFHSFCNEIIKNNPEEFPNIISSTPASNIDQIRILEKIIDNSSLKILKPYGDTYYFLHPIISKIRELKRENIDPYKLKKITEKQKKDFKEIPGLYHMKGSFKGKMLGKFKVLEKNIEKNFELCVIYKKYQSELEKSRLYDYEDMILETLKVLLKNNDLLLRLEEQYQYILADEHQDANNAQNKILELLCSFHKNPNLFIVGDEKQAIYKFQGASLDNFLYFKKLYPNVKLIKLEKNYRSTQLILDAAHSLINSGNQPFLNNLRIPLKAKLNKGEDSKILYYSFSKSKFEVLFLAQDIKEKINSGINPSQIAVLYRNNKDALPFIEVFEKEGFPFSVESDTDIFLDNNIQKLIILFRGVNDLGNDEAMSRTLFLDFFNIDVGDIYKILRYSNKKKNSILDSVRSEKYLKEASVENILSLKSFSEKILYWSRIAKNENLIDFLGVVSRESGFINHILKGDEAIQKFEKFDVLISEIKKIITNHKEYRLSDFIEYLDTLKEHEVYIKTEGKSSFLPSVRLMTAHKSKGLEFEYVYITGCNDGHWGGKREVRYFQIPFSNQTVKIADDSSSIDDERRLFFVAITRAKKSITLTLSNENENGKLLLPSQFIGEINEKYLKKNETKENEKKMIEKNILNFTTKKNIDMGLKNKEYLKNLFIEQGLSVSALNNYLECPWKFFFNSLIRLPQAETKNQLYGTAVHRAFKDFFDKWKTGDDLNKERLILSFENYLKKSPMNKTDFKESYEKGKKSISGYYNNYKNKWIRNIINELNIAGVYIDLDNDRKIMLKGKLDKLEIEKDGTVNVVDYKTSKPKTRNDIEGKTKTSLGNLKRQLVFYKILLDSFEKGKLAMTSGEIDFIEPDEKGKYKKEKFFINEEDVVALKQLIKKTVISILDFSFINSKCDKKDCQFCRLSFFIK